MKFEETVACFATAVLRRNQRPRSKLLIKPRQLYFESIKAFSTSSTFDWWKFLGSLGNRSIEATHLLVARERLLPYLSLLRGKLKLFLLQLRRSNIFHKA